MTVASNKYASKNFSEHPIGLWPLDDDAYYLSLISNSERDITAWTLTNCTATSSPSLPDVPSPFFDDTNYYGIIGDHTALGTSGGTISLRSGPIFTFNELNQDLDNFAINLFIYQGSVFTSSYQIGFRYFNTATSSYEEVLVDFDKSIGPEWIRLGGTFDVSEFDTDTCEIILKIDVFGGGLAGDYDFVVNGLSVGQWSELFSAKSLGSTASAVPASTGLTSVYGIAADQYGPLSDNAYYIIENQSMLAKNDGVPLVFGSENCTKISPSYSNLPSLIFPGKGFLAKSGEHKVYSVEFWMRISPNTKNEKRIFGPLDSDYGLYISEGFLTLLIGNNFATYNVDEWYRPMLVNIILNETNAQVFINGEQVIEIDINRNSLDLPENEWMGFYSYDDIELFEIDCISIFPYAVPLQVARRRFVWGQGVSSQQTIDSSFKGETTSISFPNSNYAVNMIYPDKERWDAAYYNNLTATSTSISSPSYSLPEIFLSGRDLQLWYEANNKINNIEYPLGDHPKFFTFRPGLNSTETVWERTGPNWTEKFYLEFSNANIASAPISAIYGVFEVEDDIIDSRPLIHIVNSLTGKRFEINISSYDISYAFDGIELYTEDTSGQDHVIVGIHIPTISETFGYDIASFFSSYQSLRIYIGGAPDTELNTYETFEGKIYKIAFADASNYNQISDHFNVDGFANYEDDSFFVDHFSTYAVKPFYRYNRFFLDVSVSSLWEEYFPLSSFAAYAYDAQGSQYYGIDFLQFNIGYPSIINETIIGDDIEFDTSESSVQMYATFQLIAEGANEPLESFTYEKDLINNFVVYADEEDVSVDPYKPYKTKFNIVDGTIIYPPKQIKFEDVAIVIHLVINQDGILSKPLKIRDMEIASKVLNSTAPNAILTKFGKSIYPYVKNGIYFNYKEKNPFTIYKKDTPYLFLTKNSGVRVFNNIEKENGALIPINESRQNNYFIGAMQIFIKYESNKEQNTAKPIFEIQYKDSTIEFMLISDSSAQRYQIYARDKWSLEPYTNIIYYQNGINVIYPFFLNGEWNSLGFVFKDALDFSNFTGSINIFDEMTFNNVSTYLPSGLNEIASVIARSWQGVKTDGITDFDWQYWYDENGLSDVQIWQDIYTLAREKIYAVSAATIYSSYIGTNINVVDDDAGISIFNDDFAIISGAIWSSIVEKPA